MAAVIVDTTPASEPATVASSSGFTASDGYGSLTASAGTALLRVIPPKAGQLTSLGWFSYDCGATSHTLTTLVSLAKVYVATESATGQAVIKTNAIPTAADGSIIAANDYIITKNENDVFEVYSVASISGLNITITTSVGAADGSGVTTKLPIKSPVWFMGAAADHTKRQFTMKASTVTTWGGAGLSLCRTKNVNEPILIHSNNATNAGILSGVAFEYIVSA